MSNEETTSGAQRAVDGHVGRRVLDTDGVLVFKWSETQVKVKEVLELTPVPPLFGHISGRKGLTHWLVFMTPTRR